MAALKRRTLKQPILKRRWWLDGALALAGWCLSVTALAGELTPVTVSTTWYAQAEHGGLYAAKAMGLYQKHGLDVTIKMGGPQVNNVQLLVGGVTDFSMGYSLQSFNAVKQGLPLVTVAAFFQKDPQSLMVHEGQGYHTIADLQGAGLRIPTAGRVAYWPWLKAKYGFTDDQLRPYDYTARSSPTRKWRNKVTSPTTVTFCGKKTWRQKVCCWRTPVGRPTRRHSTPPAR